MALREEWSHLEVERRGHLQEDMQQDLVHMDTVRVDVPHLPQCTVTLGHFCSAGCAGHRRGTLDSIASCDWKGADSYLARLPNSRAVHVYEVQEAHVVVLAPDMASEVGQVQVQVHMVPQGDRNRAWHCIRSCKYFLYAPNSEAV